MIVVPEEYNPGALNNNMETKLASFIDLYILYVQQLGIKYFINVFLQELVDKKYSKSEKQVFSLLFKLLKYHTVNLEDTKIPRF